MPTFDITSEYNTQEITNAVDQAYREIVNRYDFRDTGTNIEFNEQTKKIKTKRNQNQNQVKKIKLMKKIIQSRIFPFQCLDFIIYKTL